MTSPRATVSSWPPNYVEVFDFRQRQLILMKRSAEVHYGALQYYSKNCEDFIAHWCDTYDPRNAGTDLPSYMPFVIFQRQREFIRFILACLEAQESGLVEKCRDVGVTWLCCAISVWLWLFVDGVSVGWGSRKEQLVDRIGDPDSIFEKMRVIISRLPEEFLPAGFAAKDHMSYMRMINPETMATITGESGDNIGRGGRKRIYFKDESAHYEHPEKIEAALGDNTRCQIDVSSVTGLGTVFHRRREAGVDWVPGAPIAKGRTNVFVFGWRDHPAKTQEWYDERRRKAVNDGLLHVFAQEVDRDYAAAIEGVVIPAPWVAAAIDAHIRLGIKETGAWGAALDVADEGGDTNALSIRRGIVLKSVDEWGERDTGFTTRRAINQVRDRVPLDLQYDCIGIGAGVKAEYNRLKEDGDLPKNLTMVPWNAGDAVLNPEGRVIPGDRQSPLNEDFYTNFKAQAWWQGRRRFEITYRAIRSISGDASREEKKFTWDDDELISIDSSIPLLRKLQKELSQATMGQGSRLKMLINKNPDGTKSPNLADSVIMNYWPAKSKKPIVYSDEFVARTARA